MITEQPGKGGSGTRALSDEQHETGDDQSTGGVEAMADLEGIQSAADAGPPFADWREQLRERVKEIRARKETAAQRIDAATPPSEPLPQINERSAAEKLQAAREQAARAAEKIDEPTPGSPGQALGLSRGVRAERRAGIVDVVDSLLHSSDNAGDDEGPADLDVSADRWANDPSDQPASPLMSRGADGPELGATLDATRGETTSPASESVPDVPTGELADTPDDAPLFQDDPAIFDDLATFDEYALLEPADEADDDDLELADDDHREARDLEEAAGDRRDAVADQATANQQAPIETGVRGGPAVGDDPWAHDDALGEPDRLEGDPVANKPLPSWLDGPALQAEDTDDADGLSASDFDSDPQPTDASMPIDDAPPPTARRSATERALDPSAPPVVPSWARSLVEEAADPIQPAAAPDLTAIPPEMKDVEIPAWALPRSRAGVPASEPPAAADPEPAAPRARRSRADRQVSADDVHLVGEFVAGAGRDRRPDDAPGPAVRPLASDTHQAEPPHVDKPDAVVRAGRPDRGADRHPAAPTFPGLFDPDEVTESTVGKGAETNAAEPADQEEAALVDAWAALNQEQSTAPASFDDEPFKTRPDVPGRAPVIDEEFALSAGVTAHGDNEMEPAGAPSLDWDLDAPVDPETVLGARREMMDPTAPVSDRVFSTVADALVMLTIGLLLSVGGASAAGTPVLPFVAAAPIPFAAAWLLFGLVYGMMFVGTCGQTLGKMAMRVRVIGTDTFHVGYQRAAQRTLWYALASLPAFLGLLTALRDPERRGLHDRLSGTRVVKA